MFLQMFFLYFEQCVQNYCADIFKVAENVKQNGCGVTLLFFTAFHKRLYCVYLQYFFFRSEFFCTISAFCCCFKKIKQVCQIKYLKNDLRNLKLCLASTEASGGGGLTQPIPGDGGADQLRGVPIIGQPPSQTLFDKRGPE